MAQRALIILCHMYSKVQTLVQSFLKVTQFVEDKNLDLCIEADKNLDLGLKTVKLVSFNSINHMWP